MPWRIMRGAINIIMLKNGAGLRHFDYRAVSLISLRLRDYIYYTFLLL